MVLLDWTFVEITHRHGMPHDYPCYFYVFGTDGGCAVAHVVVDYVSRYSAVHGLIGREMFSFRLLDVLIVGDQTYFKHELKEVGFSLLILGVFYLVFLYRRNEFKRNGN